MRTAATLLILLLAGAELLHFGLTGYVVPAPLRPTPPSVIFILIDTLRADRLTGTRNGQLIMPHLSAFATVSRNYTHAISPSTWTRPAVSSLMTGLPMDAHRVEFINRARQGAPQRTDRLSGAHETLAEYLTTCGYDTLAILSNGNIAPGTGLEQGFREYNLYPYLDKGRANQVTNRALVALAQLTPPFLLYVHYTDPHGPYDPPPPHDTALGPVPAPTATDSTIFMDRHSFREFVYESAKRASGLDVPRAFPPISDQGKERFKALYDGECHFVDEEAARFIEAVRAQHPDALIIVTSDHGEEFWEHRGMGHGTNLYREQTHVPLILHGKKLAPATVDTPVGTIGIAHAITDYAGLKPRDHWHGAGLLDQTPTPAPVYSRTHGATPAWGIDLNGLVDGNTKAVHHRIENTMALYDQEADHDEQHNVAEDRPADAEDYRALLNAHLKAARKQAHGNVASSTMDAEMKRQLHKLGYLEDDE